MTRRRALQLKQPVIVIYAATAIGGTLCIDDECLETAEFDVAAIPSDDLAFPAHTTRFATTWPGFCTPLERGRQNTRISEALRVPGAQFCCVRAQACNRAGAWP